MSLSPLLYLESSGGLRNPYKHNALLNINIGRIRNELENSLNRSSFSVELFHNALLRRTFT